MRNNETVHVAFVGNPNCGKTTLFKLLRGEHIPDNGGIHNAFFHLRSPLSQR